MTTYANALAKPGQPLPTKPETWDQRSLEIARERRAAGIVAAVERTSETTTEAYVQWNSKEELDKLLSNPEIAGAIRRTEGEQT